MTRWRRAPNRRPRQVAAGSPKGKGRGPARAKGRGAVVVDEYDGLILLRSSPDASPRPEGVAELVRFLAAGEQADGVFTVVVGAQGAGAALWTRLGTVLDSLRARGVKTVRLVLSGAGRRHADRPAMAQRIADAWGIEVIAPDAGVLIVPGGSLFALGADGPDRGWRSFTPGAESVPLGPRSPAPAWQPALARLPGRTAGGYVVEQVPAGVLVRSVRSPSARAGDLCYAVPVDGDHPAVLVRASESRDAPNVPAEDLASLLAGLPATTRSAVRLAPCGPLDLLPVGQDTAELLGAEVEVLSGLPLLVGAEADPVVRPVMIGAGDQPTWAPYVEAVACRPYGTDGTVSALRLVRWRPPVPGIDHTEPGVFPLSDRWQVSVTRSGLVVGPRGETPPFAGRPVSAEQMAVEVNLRGAPADDTLTADLSRVLSAFEPGVRDLVALHRLRPARGADDAGFGLLRLAIQHGVSLVEPRPGEAPPAPGAPTVRTVAIPRDRPEREAPGAASAPPPAAGTGSTAPATADVQHESLPQAPPATQPRLPAPPVPARPRESSGTKPLPPSLAIIPLTPVTPRETAQPSPAPAPPTSPQSATPPEPPKAPPAPPEPPEAPPAPEPAPSRSGPSVPDTPPAVAKPGPAARAARSRPLTKPVRRSTEAERAEFRSIAQPLWERHSAAVNRAMTRMPALRGAQVDAARTDLVAVHLYLGGDDGELPDEDPGSYIACLASGLCRLPSYRGVAVRGGLAADGGLERFLPGAVIHEPGPVSALPIGVAAGLSAAAGGYVIWSSTGRRVRPLLGSGAGAVSDEVVFPPGTAFRVLDVRSADPAPIVLLSEVPGARPDDRPGALNDADRATLERLDEALRRQAPSQEGTAPDTWPARCTEPLGGEMGRP